MNNNAHIAITRLIKNDPIIKFIKNTNNANAPIGAEQYIMKHNVCNIGLWYYKNIHSCSK